MIEDKESTALEIVNTRIINAPRELVFKMWTDPLHLAYWWGPNGFTNTFHIFELKPGGIWKFTMHAPDGIDYQNENVFVEIIHPEKIVFQHVEPIHKFLVTATFEDLGNPSGQQTNKTRLTFSMLFDSADECERVKVFVADANEQNFDRLEGCILKNWNEK